MLVNNKWNSSQLLRQFCPENLHRIKARYRKHALWNENVRQGTDIFFYRNQSSALHFQKSNLGAYSLHSLSIQSWALRYKQTKFEQRQNEVELVQPELLKKTWKLLHAKRSVTEVTKLWLLCPAWGTPSPYIWHLLQSFILNTAREKPKIKKITQTHKITQLWRLRCFFIERSNIRRNDW